VHAAEYLIQMSASTRIVKNTGYLYVKMGVTVLISLYTTRLVLQALGAADFGVFSVVGGSIALLSFLNGSMSAATQRFMSYYAGEGDLHNMKVIFNNAVLLHIIMALLLSVLLFSLKPLFFYYVLNIDVSRVSDAENIYYFMIISTAITVLTVPYNAVVNAHENMLFFSIVGVVESLLKLSIAFFLLSLSSHKLIWYGFLMTVVTALIMIVMSIYCRIRYEECELLVNKYFDKKILEKMASFAGWNLLGNSSGVMSGYGSELLLNHFFGTRLNATKGVLGQLNGQMLAFSNNMLKAVNPVIVKSEGQNNREKMFLLTFTSCKMSFAMFAFLAIPFIVECQYILDLWLVEIPPFLVAFCTIGFIQTMIEQLSIPLSTAINAVGKIKWINITISIIHFSTVFILYDSFKRGSVPYFMQQLMVICAILILLARLTFCTRHLKMPLFLYFKEVVAKCLICSAVTLSIAFLIHFSINEGLLRLTLVTIGAFIIFIILMMSFGLSSWEKSQVVLIYNKVKKKTLG